MAASIEQKLDFLLKKIGYVASKTGIAEDSTLTGTKKAPFGEAIPSPLVTPATSIWADSIHVPATPPGSDTSYVKVYLSGSSGHQMTMDPTVSGNRTFVARSTYNNNSSAILGDWVDTSYGPDYIVKVYKGDPNSGGVQLSAAGSGSNDTWFFDYSSGVLNFNGTVVPSGVTSSNIYIVGYRYIGAKGAIPPAGIATFSNLYVSGVSTFVGVGTFNSDLYVGGNLEIKGTSTFRGGTINLGDADTDDINIGGEFVSNLIPDVDDTYDLGSPSKQWRNLYINGHTELDNVNVSGITTFANALDINSDIDVDGHTELDNVNIAGVTTFQSNAFFGDADYIQMGDSQDLKIGHVGSYSVILDQGEGNLSIGGDGYVDIMNTALNEYKARFITNGAVELYWDNSKKLETIGYGVTVSGGLGVSGVSTFYNDIHVRRTDGNIRYLNFYDQNSGYQGAISQAADGGNGRLDINGKYLLRLSADNDVEITDGAYSSTKRAVFKDGPVELYYGSSASSTKKFETTGYGVSVYDTLQSPQINITGVSTFTGNVSFGSSAFFGDNDKIFLGDDDDFEIYHDGNSYVSNTNSASNLFITSALGLQLRVNDSEAALAATADGTVELFYNGDEKFETTGAGVTVFGTTETQQLNVTGVTTIFKANGSDLLNLTRDTSGGGTDIGFKFSVNNPSGNSTVLGITRILGNTSILNISDQGVFYPSANGSVDLGKTSNRFENFYVLNIDADGDLDVDGHTNLDNVSVAGVSTFANHVHLGDDDELRFGAGNDFKIYHDPNDARIENSNGDIKFKNTGSYFFFDEDGGETLASFINDGAVNLYYDASKKFETTGYGVTVFGTTQTQQLNVSGVATATAFHTGAEGSAIRVTSNTISGPAEMFIDPAAVGDNTGALRIKGDLFVDGTQTVINSTTIELGDFIVGIATTATTDLLADGAGIKIGPDNTFLYDHTNTSLKSSENLNLASGKTYKIDGTDVLSATTLGSGVVNSSLTSLGTLLSLTVSGQTTLNTLNVTGVSTFTSAVGINSDLTLTNTDSGSAAGPEFKLYRNSASPADADYLGQIKFAGESDTGVERNYAKITGKILDASNTNEDGIIEFAHIKAGSQTITGRFRSDSLQLLNGTNFSVAGNSTFTGNIDVDGHTELDNVNISGVVTATTINATTFAGNGDFVDIDVDGHTELDNVNIAGVVTATTINATTFAGNGDFVDIDVDGHANLDNVSVAGVTTFAERIVGAATSNVIPFLYSTFEDLPSASTYHGAFAHAHNRGKGYFAHSSNWYELVNKEQNGTVGTGTERYNVGQIDATDVDVSGITTSVSLHVGVGGTVITASGIGSVGINSTAPAYALDVVGDINSSTDIKVNGVSIVVSGTPASTDDVVALAIALG